MLRSLYAYKGTHARTLEFQAGEKFLEIGQSCDPNWIHVISERGALGYVPKNYVTLEESQPEDILEFIHGSIEANLNASERGGSNSRSEHEALHKLVELRQKWYSKAPPSSQHPSKRPAPPPPQRTSSQLSVDSVGSPSGGQMIPCASRVYLLSSLNKNSVDIANLAAAASYRKELSHTPLPLKSACRIINQDHQHPAAVSGEVSKLNMDSLLPVSCRAVPGAGVPSYHQNTR